MAIYRVDESKITPIQQTDFATEKIRERDDLQQLLKNQIDIIAPDCLVIAEEFGNWQDSRRRIDLLAVDKDANLVVVELKRTEDGGHMDLQALRYSAMVSTLTFDKAVDIFTQYLSDAGNDGDARSTLIEFLDWTEQDEDQFAQDVRIVLASAEFSKEITSTILWLNDHGLDIKCVRLRPYRYGDDLLLDVQQIIPLPESAEYQVQLRDKARRERTARTQNRDFTKYDVTINGETYERLAKRHAVFKVVKHLCDRGINPDDIAGIFTWNKGAFRSVEGEVDSDTYAEKFLEHNKNFGTKSEPARYFFLDDELIHANGKTYALTKMWGRNTEKALGSLLESYHDLGFSFSESTE